MTQFKGTPGPWKCEERYTGWVVKSELDFNLQPIAYEIANGKDYGEHDAHLIAATPELLEVCEKLLEWDKKLESELTEIVASARAAINKALNQQP